MATLKERLKELRCEKGKTQRQVSMDLHLAQESISAYERKGTVPSIDVLILFTQYYNVSLDYLIGISDVRHIVSQNDLDGFESSLIHYYRKMSLSEKELLLKIIIYIVEYKSRNSNGTS